MNMAWCYLSRFARRRKAAATAKHGNITFRILNAEVIKHQKYTEEPVQNPPLYAFAKQQLPVCPQEAQKS